MARADDGRIVFVRHSLPGERVEARVTAETSSYLRADAVRVLEPSPDRVAVRCPHAGPGRCGGCDWQHASLPAQRLLKSALASEQLHRLAGVERTVEIEEVPGAPDGLGWRTRVRFAVDGVGRIGLHKHRSHDIEPVEHCPIASPEVDLVGAGSGRWRGAHHVEITASPDGGTPVVSVEVGRRRRVEVPSLEAGLVVNGRTCRDPDRVRFEALGHAFEVSSGVFWQVHPGAAARLAHCVLEALEACAGERVADLFAGAGLFTAVMGEAVGRSGSVVAVERSARACADLRRNTARLDDVSILRMDVTPSLVGQTLGNPDLVVLDPPRAGAGPAVMKALDALRPAPRRVCYVACDPASFARDLRALLDAGWTIRSLWTCSP